MTRKTDAPGQGADAADATTAAARGPVSPADAQALKDGRHGDPFRVLGPHTHGGQPWIVAHDPAAARWRR